MKMITLCTNYDDGWDVKVLFAINNIDDSNEAEFLKRIKKVVKPFISNSFSSEIREEKAELQAKEFLNIVKQNKWEMWLGEYECLSFEEIEVL